jgi:uncharacterized cupredoxin-like copper-binding protein
MLMHYRLATLAAALVACLAMGSCGGDSAPSAKSTVRVTERDFKISVPQRLAPGVQELSVVNKGPARHELIVVRKHGDELPLRRDELTVDEDAIEPVEAGALEPGVAGARRMLRVNLKPGRYEFICNMAGHYMGGMEKDVVVG